MPDLAIARLARAARRAMSQFATAGNGATAAILMWLTAQAAGETAPAADAPANGGDRPDGPAPGASPPDTHTGKSNADADASENGTRAPVAGTATDGADQGDAHGESATNGRANGGDQNGGHASVGSSTNPTLLFPEQMTNGVARAPSFGPTSDAAPTTNGSGDGAHDRVAPTSSGGNTDGPPVVVSIADGNDNAPIITSNGGGASASISVAENTTAVTTVTATDADAGS